MMIGMQRIRPHHVLVSLLAVTALTLGACSTGGSAAEPKTSGTAASPAGTDTSGSDDATGALEAGTPEERVEVPSDEGAVSIVEYAAGGSSYEPSDEDELAQILSLVGTDADGFLTADAVVVQSSEADATLWCKTADGLGISTYTLIPVLPDGTGVNCG